MGYNPHSNQRYVYVEMHRRELYAAVAQARLERQARGPRWVRRYVGALLIAAGQALAYQAHDTACAACALAPAAAVCKHG